MIYLVSRLNFFSYDECGLDIFSDEISEPCRSFPTDANEITRCHHAYDSVTISMRNTRLYFCTCVGGRLKNVTVYIVDPSDLSANDYHTVKV